MKKILENLALIHLNNFAKENNINISGTYLLKKGRGFKWCLVKYETQKELIYITFYKHQVPTFIINKNK